MSAIWGIVDLSVAQSEAQRKNRAGNLWEEALRMRQAYRTSCLDRIQEKREATYYLGLRGTECHKGSCGRKIPL